MSSVSSGAALDRLGIAASVTCAVHCAVLPLLLMALPLIDGGWLVSERSAFALIGLVAAVGSLALTLGFRAHRRWAPVALGAMGIGLLLIGELAEDRVGGFGVAIGLGGSAVMVGAHFANRRLCAACAECAELGRLEAPDDDR